MAIDTTNGIIELNFRYKFSVEKVYAALEQGRLFDVVGGIMNLGSHEFKVGGRFKTHYNASGFESGCYIEIEPLKKVSFTWESSISPLKSSVEISLKQEGNFTKLNLKHVLSNEDKAMHSYHQGWTDCLAAFVDELDGTTVRVEKEFPVSLEKLFQAVSEGKLFEHNGCSLEGGEFKFLEGGSFNLPIGQNDFFKGTFLKIVKNDRIDFSLESMHNSESIGITKVALFFKQTAANQSKLYLIHDGFATFEHSEGFRLGWIKDLQNFAQSFIS